MPTKIRKVLIANRGEIACRVARACRELGVQSVAIFSEADRDSLHTRIADEAVCVGSGSNADSYLNLANVLMAAQISGADAVHPGYGYFSERANFVGALDSLNIKFIGPPQSAIEAMGDKASAKKVAIAAGCPVVPGSNGVVHSEAEAQQAADGIGYPILFKAVAGGGGRGIRRVDSAEDVPMQFKTAQAEAQASFGSGDLMIEKCVIDPRHVEIQVLGDAHGNMVYMGERECSVQNLRHQKIVEEAPCAALPEKVRQRMGELSVKIAKAVGYQNAGTVEFLLDQNDRFYFLEMNTRLQVEHPITEEVTGWDIVQLQLRLANGEVLPLKQRGIQSTGHSIEARITAQDPDKDFAPSTGCITVWNAPGGRGVRIETHCYAGFSVSPFYDPQLAKVIVTAQDRPQAVRKLQTALHEFEVSGIATNIPFLRRLLAHPDFVEGRVTTSFVPNFLAMEP